MEVRFTGATADLLRTVARNCRVETDRPLSVELIPEGLLFRAENGRIFQVDWAWLGVKVCAHEAQMAEEEKKKSELEKMAREMTQW
jgi:hypothetical protein